jgi:hypothetical protein
MESSLKDNEDVVRISRMIKQNSQKIVDTLAQME